MAAVATSRSGLAAVHPASSRRPPRWDPLSWVAAPPRRPGVRVCECVGAGCVWPEVPGASGQLSSRAVESGWQGLAGSHEPGGGGWPGLAGGAGRALSSPQRPVRRGGCEPGERFSWRPRVQTGEVTVGGAGAPDALGRSCFLSEDRGFASGSGG